MKTPLFLQGAMSQKPVGFFCFLCKQRKLPPESRCVIPDEITKRQIFLKCLLLTTSKDVIEDMLNRMSKSTTICERHVPGYRERRPTSQKVPIPIPSRFVTPPKTVVHASKAVARVPHPITSPAPTSDHDYITSPRIMLAKSLATVKLSDSKSRNVSRKLFTERVATKRIREDSGGDMESVVSKDNDDYSYVESNLTLSSDSECEMEEVTEENSIENNFNETYFMVKGSELLKLVPNCRCGATARIAANSIGACPVIRTNCECGEKGKWYGSPKLTDHPSERKREINTIFPMAVFTGGLSYARIVEVANTIDLKLPSRQYYHTVLRHIGHDAVKEVYNSMMEQIRAEIKKEYGDENPKIDIGTDAQFDSMGYCALIGKVTLMDMRTRYVLMVFVKDRNIHGGGCSGAMELVGTKEALQYVLNIGWGIRSLTTDRSTTIRKFMKETYGEGCDYVITHYFDRWHLLRNITNAIRKKSKAKKHALLAEWSKATLAHLFHSITYGKGEPKLTAELIQSHFKHVLNIHDWSNDDQFEQVKKCNHDPISSTHRGYMKASSDSYAALRDIVNDKTIEDLSKCNPDTDTSSVESFHAMSIKFAWKRGYYAHEYHTIRMMLVQMEWNSMIKEEREGTRFVARRQNYQPKYRSEPIQRKIKVGGQTREWRKNVIAKVRTMEWDILEGKRTLRKSDPDEDTGFNYDSDADDYVADPFLDEKYIENDLFGETEGANELVMAPNLLQDIEDEENE